MNFINNTNETITLEPGEGVTGSKVTVHSYEGKPYQLVMDTSPEVMDASNLPNLKDLVDNGVP